MSEQKTRQSKLGLPCLGTKRKPDKQQQLRLWTSQYINPHPLTISGEKKTPLLSIKDICAIHLRYNYD